MRVMGKDVEDFKVENFDFMKISGRLDGMTFESIIREPDFHCVIRKGDDEFHFHTYIPPSNLRTLAGIRQQIEGDTSDALVLTAHGHPGDVWAGRRKTLDELKAPWTTEEVAGFLGFVKQRDAAMTSIGGETEWDNSTAFCHAALRELSIPLTVSASTFRSRQRLETRAARLTDVANRWFYEATPEARIAAICETIARRAHKVDHRRGLTSRILGHIAHTFELEKLPLELEADRRCRDQGVNKAHLLQFTHCVAAILGENAALKERVSQSPEHDEMKLGHDLIEITKKYGVTADFIRDAVEMKLAQDNAPGPSM